ncbi:Bug family tripartite tricarboxylate transporter substrate binding protein [Bordetella bronchialis]|uniref:MFS transporter n=1 Tax=Bordetella bronchialis TaxID=463025 RepID=A0A193FZA6_9BORD|nr:tripartite tricarboxylate transporter substrate binding protein [Bordetella bronchialis]ANN67430.1 MFS transporter [Bordetella bronchialis]ANN72521.1 MFS transporter [Bordetella bronchialis]
MYASRRRLALTAAVLGAGLALAMGTVQAQEDTYPAKAVRIVVPYPVGGFNDTLGRLVAAKLAPKYKQPVIVENKPGGGTVIGTQSVAMSAPDGYTLLVVQFPFASNPSLYKLPYDTEKAFTPVVLAGRSPMMLVTHAGSPLHTLKDVLAAAKARPGGLNYGSSGPGSSNHLAMALFESMSGTRMTQVPYKGSTPMLTDLAGAQVDLAVDLLPNALPFLKSGKVRALAVASAARSPLMPELPTAAEAGLPGYEVESWHGFVVPAGTPPAIVDKLNRDLNEVLAMPDIKEAFAQQGVVPDGGTPEDFRRFIATQVALWKKVVRDGHITVE